MPSRPWPSPEEVRRMVEDDDAYRAADQIKDRIELIASIEVHGWGDHPTFEIVKASDLSSAIDASRWELGDKWKTLCCYTIEATRIDDTEHWLIKGKWAPFWIILAGTTKQTCSKCRSAINPDNKKEHQDECWCSDAN